MQARAVAVTTRLKMIYIARHFIWQVPCIHSCLLRRSTLYRPWLDRVRLRPFQSLIAKWNPCASISSACHSSDWTIIIISTNQWEQIRENESKQSSSERRKGNQSESDLGRKMREIASTPCCTSPSPSSPSPSSITRQPPRRCRRRRRRQCECCERIEEQECEKSEKAFFMDEQRKLYLWPGARSVLVDAWLGVRAIFLWLQFANGHGQNKAKEEEKEERKNMHRK